MDLIKLFKYLDEPTIHRSNAYYEKYGAYYLVENLAWSDDRVLNTCKDSLRDKVQERLVGVSELESGDPLVLKKMLDIVMDVDDSALCSLTEALQNIRITEVPGENVRTVVSYVKGALLLLQNCVAVPTETMGIINNVMISAKYDEFTDYMTSIYFVLKRNQYSWCIHGVSRFGRGRISDVIS